MINSIELGEQKISYDLKRTKRKSMGMTINSKGRLTITAPDYIPLDKIEDVLRKRKSWILEKLEEKDSNLQLQPKRRFVSGESIYFLGQQYYLKIIQSSDFYVEKSPGKLVFYMKDPSQAEREITEWLKAEFESLIADLTPKCLNKFKSVHTISEDPIFKIRKMSKRWGSCTSERVILLNSMLIAASVECIEYVVFHELCHLLYSDHSEGFFGVLMDICPDYKMTKDSLDRETVLFENT